MSFCLSKSWKRSPIYIYVVVSENTKAGSVHP